ncbi:uncharacterized protein [Haliotis asinina]|uniref:uncharacterized protein n=1 Tax=Haliotis asinina TaxID=109174 RepID=UPI003531B7C5
MGPVTQLIVLILTQCFSGVTSFVGEMPMFVYMCAEEGVYPRYNPWDCGAYIMCNTGKAYPFQCPPGTVYSRANGLCDWPHKVDLRHCSNNPLGRFDHMCKWNPSAKLPSQLSCSQYFDCSQSTSSVEYVKYVMECPYPQLFSDVHGRCLHFKLVQCGKRPMPVAPCDYIQYQQMCPDPRTCAPCHQRHPSCSGLVDGYHPVTSSRNHYMYCDSGRTLSIGQCPAHQIYSRATGRCSAGIQ